MTHGNTLTSSILFRDVITAVATYAFTASPYPVILSLENHCEYVQAHGAITHYLLTRGQHPVFKEYAPSAI